MKVYILYTSYPYEGGFIHGIFTSPYQAERALESEEFEWSHQHARIKEVLLDDFEFQKIEI